MIFNSGGGTALNFAIRKYSSEAALLASQPRQNTIGLVTENKLTGWYLSFSEPEEKKEGTAWILTGTKGDSSFNALKKNGIQIVPLMAKQYISGSWVQIPAKIYKNGAWVSWMKYLYINGDECTDLTGGWVSQKHSSGTAGNVEKLSDRIQLSTTANVYASTIEVRTSKTIDFTDVDMLEIDVISRTGMENAQNYIGVYAFLSSSSAAGQKGGTLAYNTPISAAGKHSINLTNCSGKYYVIIACYGASVAFTEISGK